MENIEQQVLEIARIMEEYASLKVEEERKKHQNEVESIKKISNESTDLYLNSLQKAKDALLNNQNVIRTQQSRIEELTKALTAFVEAIESEIITIQENTDNDGWENVGGLLYEQAKQALNSK
jgi:hypothetical protein